MPQDLDKELEMLHSTIAELKDSAVTGTEEEVALLSLVVNSLERQHGVRAVEDDSEEDEAAEEAGIEDEDEVGRQRKRVWGARTLGDCDTVRGKAVQEEIAACTGRSGREVG